MAEGIPRIYLDSRQTAQGFYRKLGFQFHTSIPCWVAGASGTGSKTILRHRSRSSRRR